MRTTRQQRWTAGIALAAALTLTGATAVTAQADPPTPPTVQQAQAALDHIDQDQATIQAWIDSTNVARLPQNVAVVNGDGTATITWDPPTTGDPTGYIYGRDGNDTANSGVYVSATLPATARTATLDKLVNGTGYHVYVEAVYADGDRRVTLDAFPIGTVGPTPTATPTASSTPTATGSPTPTSTATATATGSPTATSTGASTRASGLAWSSGVGPQPQSGARANQFATYRGTPVDNVTLFPPRDSWSSLSNPSNVSNGLPAGFNAARDDLVMSIPMWPGSNNVSSTGTQAQWQTLASMIAGFDANADIRLGWEMNLNNAWNLNSGNSAQWRADFHQAVLWMHAVAPGLQIVWNPNKGGDQTSGCSAGCQRPAFQALKADIDVYAIDSYDSFPADNTSGNRTTHLTSYLGDALNYAVANGKKFAVPEWGEACNTSGCQWVGNSGGDNPQYVHDYVGWFVATAATNPAYLAFESYFDEPGDYIRAALDVTPIGPNAAAQYRSDILANVHH
jgi:hypothetical protein